MQTFRENKPHQLPVWYLQIDQLERSGTNLEEPNEYSWEGGSEKQEK